MSKLVLGLAFLSMAAPAMAEQWVSDKAGHYYNNPDSPYYQKHRPVLFGDQKDQDLNSVHFKMRHQNAQ
jgi:hypothetical protein